MKKEFILDEKQEMLQKVVSFLDEQEPRVWYQYDYRFYLYEQPVYADLFLSEGFSAKGIDGPTIVELKNRLGADTLYRYYESFRVIREGMYIRNFILIYNDKNEFSSSILRQFEKYRNEGFFVFSVSTFCKRMAPKKEPQTRTDLPQKPSLSESEKRQRLIEKAHAAFIRGHSTLFLGAGVSCSVGVPKWDDFLKALLKRTSNAYIKEGDFPCVNESCDHSSIISGRYIKNGFAKDQAFEKEMKKALYAKHPIPKSPLFDELVEMICSRKQISEDYCVDQAITFNYDDLLEAALRMTSRCGKSIFNRTVYTGNHFPIYHVHGMIPQNPLIDSTPVLGEQEYHQLYREAYHWSNVIQLYALSRSTCFFVGLSMNDPNLRRLLDISRNGGGFNNKSIESTDPCHYAILEKKPLDWNNPTQYDKNEEHAQNIEKMMYQLGINIIWYENTDGKHSKVPDILKAIRQGYSV